MDTGRTWHVGAGRYSDGKEERGKGLGGENIEIRPHRMTASPSPTRVSMDYVVERTFQRGRPQAGGQRKSFGTQRVYLGRAIGVTAKPRRRGIVHEVPGKKPKLREVAVNSQQNTLWKERDVGSGPDERR